MAWLWILIAVLVGAALLYGVYKLTKHTPTLEDSMAVPRNVPAYKGIAEDMRRQAQVRNKDGRVP